MAKPQARQEEKDKGEEAKRPAPSLHSAQRFQETDTHRHFGNRDLGKLTPGATPNMARGKQEWELRQPQPKINPQFTGHLKAHGHNVPQTPTKPQDPYKQARQIGARLRKDGLRNAQTPSASGKPQEEVRKAGQSLRKAGVESPHDNRNDWRKTAENINGHLNRNNRGWNVPTDIEPTRKSARSQPQPQQKQMGRER